MKTDDERAHRINEAAGSALVAVAPLDADFDRILALLSAAAYTIQCTCGAGRINSACSAADSIIRIMTRFYSQADPQSARAAAMMWLETMDCAGTA